MFYASSLSAHGWRTVGRWLRWLLLVAAPVFGLGYRIVDASWITVF
jgi:hypothetical protein